ncbi:MAG: hypothetical protein AB4352_01325 [Hormoscilla sp.]
MNDTAIDTVREQAVPDGYTADKVKVSLYLDAELWEQVKHLTKDPSKIVERAVRQWLRGDAQRDDDLTRTLPKNPPVSPRGEWND